MAAAGKLQFKLLVTILLVLTGLYGLANYHQAELFLYAKFRQYLTFSPCDKPTGYKIGSIDSRFGLTKDQVLADARQAASVWQEAEGKQLLTYNPNASLTIDFIYDKRSSLNSQINNLQQQLSQKDQGLKDQIAAYQNQVEAFKTQLADFRAKVQALNTQIEYWNKQGGAPADEYQKLTAQQEQLRKEQQSLQAEADSLNQTAQKLNLSTQDYNIGVDQLNNTISTFNQALNQKPEEGLFDPQRQTIDIYFVNSRPELIHTLAHEMGHALGLDHNQNQKSIMYPFTTQVITASSADISSINAICSHRVLNIPHITNWI